MLPRRHILDVWELVKDEEELLSMATVTLALDALKYMEPTSGRDHLVEALELNEFICYMFPMQRPRNRSLLFHVVSDLLGLLLYGVPKKRRPTIENIESINYSEENIEIYPVQEVWNTLKDKVYTKKHGVRSIVEGFVKKIRIEMAVMEEYPFVEDILFESRERISEWVPSLSRYYEKDGEAVKSAYEKWWNLWSCGTDRRRLLAGMVGRLSVQAERDFAITLDREALFDSLIEDREENSQENQCFSRWYLEGVNQLLKI